MNRPRPPVTDIRHRLETAESPQAREAIYRELLGFVPIGERAPKGVDLAPALRLLHDRLRVARWLPASLDARTTHLILLALLLMHHGGDACTQAVAALRAGASHDDLRAVADLAFLLHGIPAANRGDELQAALSRWEHEDRIAGAVAAYG